MTRKTILIVDDDQDLSLGLGIRLRAAGYSVAVAGDAVSAIHRAVRERPDLVLLDLGLPAGDGTMVLSRLKSIQATALTPVVVMTARDITCEPAMLRLGATAFFQKPVDQEDLFAVIAMVLEESDNVANG